MGFTLSRAAGGREAIAAAKLPNLRLLKGPTEHWVLGDPASAPAFSAVAFFFGRELQDRLKVPVGLIVCSTDGSRIEPWTAAVGYEGLDGLGKAADGGIYKSKIEPLAPYAVRGVTWYQGESNLMRGETDHRCGRD